MIMKVAVSEVNLATTMRRWFSKLPEHWAPAIKDAYITMATAKKGYRPNAPSDGHGNIQLDAEALADPVRLEMEGWRAARSFYEADDNEVFEIHGCADGRLAVTMYFALEAAQRCCGGVSNGAIRTILELAIAALPESE
jgi:hypothetical protein